MDLLAPSLQWAIGCPILLTYPLCMHAHEMHLHNVILSSRLLQERQPVSVNELVVHQKHVHRDG